MKQVILSFLAYALNPMVRDRVYVARAGLVAGLKRRGGFGFVPKRAISQEELFLSRYPFRGKTVYDVGGHIGLMTMFFARAVGETGRVVTIEPNPENFRAVLDHVKLNGFANVRAIPMGLSSKPETVQFVVAGSARGTADRERQQRILTHGDARVFRIDVDSMDNQIVAHGLPKPDFIKIDVEGLEMAVLRGMPDTIRLHKPELLIELHGTCEPEIVEHLLDRHYAVHQIEDGIDLTRDNLNRVRGHIYVRHRNGR